MKTIKKLAAALLLGTGALGLAGCATGLNTKVSRYQAMPAPAGQTFYVVPAEDAAQGLEFNRFAVLVSQQLAARGYAPAGAPQLASMLVKLDYGVDEGRTEHTVDPFARSRYGYGGFGYADPFYRSRFGYYDPFYGSHFGRPYWSRFGYYGGHSPFYYGWNDPFWYASPYAGYGAGYRNAIRSYTIYKSYLDLEIVRKADNAPLFEGEAQARSQTDETGVLVPNLIEAMFTGFPGRSGETVKITVPARKK
ncbi:MAG TPA: DUF4136 domain-containing protein [Sphingomicrobium sp.]|nr:DUF4136 domain-containing protein [Sphingomicrobium sp.]